jgi:hypothetical protein
MLEFQETFIELLEGSDRGFHVGKTLNSDPFLLIPNAADHSE